MSPLLLSFLFFTGILSMLAEARPGPVPARVGLMELGADWEAGKATPLHLLWLLSPCSAPQGALRVKTHRSKTALVIAEVIAAGFFAAVVLAIFSYIRVTRKRSAENSKY